MVVPMSPAEAHRMSGCASLFVLLDFQRPGSRALPRQPAGEAFMFANVVADGCCTAAGAPTSLGGQRAFPAVDGCRPALVNSKAFADLGLEGLLKSPEDPPRSLQPEHGSCFQELKKFLQSAKQLREMLEATRNPQPTGPPELRSHLLEGGWLR